MPRQLQKPKVSRRPGETNYRVVFTHAGKQFNRSTGESELSAAERAAGRIVAQIRRGEPPSGAVRRLRKLTAIEPPEAAGVYAVADEHWRIKIGRAENIAKRFHALQCANAEKLQLLAVLSKRPEDESDIHKRFKNSRIRREWFSPSQALVNAIWSARYDVATMSCTRTGENWEDSDGMTPIFGPASECATY